MKLTNLKITEFINEVDSKSPAPGGGSVSALASSLGVALSRMVGHLSVGKKKFKALDEEIQVEFRNTIESLEAIKEELVDLIDKDTEAFNLIMAAFKLPKETTEEKAHRSLKIEEGTLEAIKVPYRVAEISLDAVSKFKIIKQYGNKNTLSDLGVSTLMLSAGIDGALMNVKINLPGITDEETKAFYTKNVNDIYETNHQLRDEIVEDIFSKL